MSEQELSRYYWLKKEVEDLTERIATFGVGISSIKIKELNVEGSARYESIQEKIAELKDKWMEKRISALEEYLKIEKYISEIDDTELKLMFRYRFLDCKKWDEIAEMLNYDRTSVSKKVRKYILSHNSHK